jgi:hypothetical protein
MKRTITGLMALGLAVAVPGGGAAAATCPVVLPRGDDPVALDPTAFVERVDNPFWPMAPGTRWLYRETDARGSEQQDEVTVTTRTKEILGIEATVVHDKVTEGGELVENTFDWYAQDVCGNVWYLGENTKEYEDGEVVTTAGSWEAGVDGAQAGIVMPVHPRVGTTYRQEYAAGEAEDGAEVLSLSEQVKVPFGHFDDVLLTKDFTPLHRRMLEYKFYAPGVGPILLLSVSGGSDRAVLVDVEAASR